MFNLTPPNTSLQHLPTLHLHLSTDSPWARHSLAHVARKLHAPTARWTCASRRPRWTVTVLLPSVWTDRRAVSGVRCRPWWEVFQAVLVFGRWLLVISLVLGRWALGVTSEVGLRSASFSALSSSRCKKRPSDHCPVTPNYRTRKHIP